MQPNEPVAAKVKFFSKEKGFGFLETPDHGEVFFHVSGCHREVRHFYATRHVTYLLSGEEKDQLVPESEVLIHVISEGKKGPVADMWTVPSLHKLPSLYFVIAVRKEEKETESQNQEKRMWLIERSSIVTAMPVFAGTKADCKYYAESEKLRHPEEGFVVAEVNETSQGALIVADSNMETVRSMQKSAVGSL